jgi:hypothetical protein
VSSGVDSEAAQSPPHCIPHVAEELRKPLIAEHVGIVFGRSVMVMEIRPACAKRQGEWIRGAEEGCPLLISHYAAQKRLVSVIARPSMLRFKLLVLDLIHSARILIARSVEVDNVTV